MMNYELDFLKALLITVVVETITLYLFIRIVFRNSDSKVWIILLAGITASGATLPYLWFIFPLFLRTKLYYTIFSELFAVGAESFILLGFLRTGYVKALILSFVCNLVSYGCGLIIHQL
jgi:hypothetical protein